MSNRPINEDDLNGFIDGRLDADERARVAAYLDAHPDVAQRTQAYFGQRDMLRAAFAPVVEEPVPPELNLAHMIETRRHGVRPPAWALVAAALALVVAGGAGGWSLRGMAQPPPGGVTALAQEAAASYAVYATDRVHPVEIRADDRVQLVDWVSQRLGRKVAIPDLAASGYRFMGGRVVATAHGPAALFMYDDDHGTRLVMLARPMADGRSTPMSPHRDGGVGGFAWVDDGLGYSLVGPTATEKLHPLADEARRQLGGAA